MAVTLQPTLTPPAFTAVPTERLHLMERAIELGVDKEDFGLYSPFEELLWDELVEEHEALIERLGSTWIADA